MILLQFKLRVPTVTLGSVSQALCFFSLSWSLILMHEGEKRKTQTLFHSPESKET